MSWYDTFYPQLTGKSWWDDVESNVEEENLFSTSSAYTSIYDKPSKTVKHNYNTSGKTVALGPKKYLFGTYGNYSFGYNALPSTDTIEKFTKIYKHLDDLKSIVKISSHIGITFQNAIINHYGSKHIAVSTHMFDDPTLEYNNQLDICSGYALIEFAYYLYASTHDIDVRSINKILYEESAISELLNTYPGYTTFVLQANKYRERELDACKEYLVKKVQQYNDLGKNLELSEEISTDNVISIINSRIDSLDLIHVVEKDLDAQIGSKKSSSINQSMFDILSGDLVVKSNNVTIRKEQDRREYYDYWYKQIHQYIQPLANQFNKFFVDVKGRHYGCRSGILDSNKLVEAIQGAPNVYYNDFVRKTNQLDIAILIDESGSMERDKRIEMAAQAAILMNEACYKISNCNLYIYGHSGDCGRDMGKTQIFTYRDQFNKDNKYALGAVCARRENRDGIAILEVAKRIREQTQNPVLFFILSDGNPYAPDYQGYFAIKDTREKVKEVEKMGFYVTQVTFRSTYVNSLAMFNNVIQIVNKDVSEFATKFTNYVANTLIKKYTVNES